MFKIQTPNTAVMEWIVDASVSGVGEQGKVYDWALHRCDELSRGNTCRGV